MLIFVADMKDLERGYYVVEIPSVWRFGSCVEDEDGILRLKCPLDLRLTLLRSTESFMEPNEGRTILLEARGRLDDPSEGETWENVLSLDRKQLGGPLGGAGLVDEKDASVPLFAAHVRPRWRSGPTLLPRTSKADHFLYIFALRKDLERWVQLGSIPVGSTTRWYGVNDKAIAAALLTPFTLCLDLLWVCGPALIAPG